jgi:signal transduction histidine kinase/CheY-like chemotaxis protein
MPDDGILGVQWFGAPKRRIEVGRDMGNQEVSREPSSQRLLLVRWGIGDVADRRRAVPAIVAVLLIAFAVWAVSLMLDVRALRKEVEERVGWLTRLSRISATLETDRAAARDDYQRVRASMKDAHQADPELADTLDTTDALMSDEAAATGPVRAAMERVIQSVRKQTAELSKKLGGKWDSLYVLVGIALVLAALTLVLLVRLRAVSRARAVAMLELAEARLRQADRLAAVGTLAAAVAHEINNPLTYVLANLRLLEKRVASDPDARVFVADAVEGTDRVAGIIRDLSAFVRRDEGKPIDIDVGEAIDAALRILAPQMRDRVNVERRFESGAHVRGQPLRLEQVFLNLIANATQALDDRTFDEASIQVSIESTDNARVCVKIRDNGPGIPAAVRDSMFEPFVTTKPLGAGTGLGLFISRGILSAMGGSLAFETPEAGGTIAIVDLPRADPRAKIEEPTDPPERQPATREKLSILLVDDEPALRRALAKMLRDHHVVVTQSGEEAIAKATTGDYDVILCDLMMEGIDGVAVYEALGRQNPSILERFVFMTGGVFTERAKVFLESIKNPCLKKPFDADDVERALRAALETR